jgi:hypothetical protein
LDLIIEQEFIIAIANNSYNLKNNIDNLIDNLVDYNILTEEEIRVCLSKKKLFNVIQMLSNFAIFRLVHESSETLIESISENYFDIDLKKVLIEANKIFHNYEHKMFIQTKNKLWIEILRTICFYYLQRLFHGKKNLKHIDDLLNKIRSDIKFLQDAFQEKLGENTIKENLISIEKLLEFFESSSDMISFSVSSLREYNGIFFTFENAKKLLDWRVDFTSKEKKSVIDDIEKILKNFKSNENENGTKNPLVDYILLERKNSAMEKNQKNNNEEGDILEGIESNNNKNDNDNNRRKTIDISDFLGQINCMQDDKLENSLDLNKTNTVNFTLSKKIIEISDDDILIQGNLKKKSSAGYIKKLKNLIQFFPLKIKKNFIKKNFYKIFYFSEFGKHVIFK